MSVQKLLPLQVLRPITKEKHAMNPEHTTIHTLRYAINLVSFRILCENEYITNNNDDNPKAQTQKLT